MIDRGHHDMGGLPGGAIDRSEHEYAQWERSVDAMAMLLWLKGAKKIGTVDEHRKNIEAMPPELYDRTGYYEKWIWALTQTLLQRGVVTTEELARKMTEVAGPRMNHDMGGQPAGKVERSGHDYAEWERRVDAMSVLLGAKKTLSVDQRRRNIEALPPEDYDRMGYYERWVASLGQSLVQLGIVTTEEMARKMVEVEKRGG